MAPTAEQRLAGFVSEFTPEVARLIRAARKKMRKLLPGAVELVYDNYNFLVIGYGPSEKAGEAIFSLAAAAGGLRLFFLHGARLPDPTGLLEGGGKQVRSVRLVDAAMLDRADVRALMEQALARAKRGIDAKAKRKLVIKSVSKNRRPRRPG